MTYEDAKEYLRIADNAYNAEAYTESAGIIEKVVHGVASHSDMEESRHEEIVAGLRQLIARFHYCPDEVCWETVSSLSDFFR